MSEHFLIIEDDGPDETAWYIEHPDDCPTYVYYEGSDGYPDVLAHACGYEYEVDVAGVDAIDDGDIPTEIGRYLLEYQSDGEGEDHTAILHVVSRTDP